MTLDELGRIALDYSERAWVKTWPAYSRPPGQPWLMAIEVRAYRVSPYTGIATLEPMRLTQLEDMGFRVPNHEGAPFLYAIERTNADGTPYGSTTDAR